MTDHTDDTPGKTPPTLSETDISTDRSVTRRRVLRGFGVGTLGLGTLAVTGCVPTTTTTGVLVGSGYTDRDNGPIVDPGGFGRGPRRRNFTGVTDRDNGPIVDAGGFGRGG